MSYRAVGQTPGQIPSSGYAIRCSDGSVSTSGPGCPPGTYNVDTVPKPAPPASVWTQSVQLVEEHPFWVLGGLVATGLLAKAVVTGLR